jgi:hypothetical protein
MELNNILQGVMIQQTEKLFGEILIKTLICMASLQKLMKQERSFKFGAKPKFKDTSTMKFSVSQEENS